MVGGLSPGWSAAVFVSCYLDPKVSSRGHIEVFLAGGVSGFGGGWELISCVERVASGI